MAKRIREVWDTGTIAHMWAHATRLSARNPQGNFSFAGNELRSYAAVIAKRVTHKKNVAFLCLDQTWSVTTAKHQSLMQRATFGDNVFQVTVFPASGAHASPTVTRAHHKMNVEHMLGRAAEFRAKANRARSNRDWLNSTAHNWRESAVRYAGLFGVRSVIPPLDDIAGTLAKLSARAERQAERERKARQKKAAEEHARLMEFLPSAIETWRTTGQHYFRDDAGKVILDARELSRLAGTDLMRFDGTNVVTSNGAVVDATIVRLMARRLLSVMGSTESIANVGRHVGPYLINGITADHVTIGCHKFSRAEITRIADALERAEIIPSQSTVNQD